MWVLDERVAFLGCIIFVGVKVDPEKVRVVLEWKQPESMSEIKSFLGLTGYYCRFIEGHIKNC